MSSNYLCYIIEIYTELWYFQLVKGILLGIVIFGTMVWFWRWIKSLLIPRGDLYLKENKTAEGVSPLPFVSILVPARNEEENIRACLTSLLKQDYPDYEIIVIDDRSTDRTPQILAEFSPSPNLLKIIHLSELPSGWTGKTHALHEGSKEARGEWFLFTDADTIHQPWSLKTAITYSLERNLDLLSLYPQSKNPSFWEKITQPLGGGILNIWYPFEQVNNPGYRTAFANGQYILVKKACYSEIGGHQGVKAELLEDVALAEKAKEKNKNIRMAYGFNLFSTRMYKNFPEIWRGWRRIFKVLLGKRKSYYPISLVLLFLLSLLPFILVFDVSLLSKGGLWTIIYLINILEIVFLYLSVGFMYRLSKNNPVWALFHPLGCLIMVGIIVDALFREIFKRPINWRGTNYPS